MLFSVDDLVHPFDAVGLDGGVPTVLDPPPCAGHGPAEGGPVLTAADHAALAAHCQGHVLLPWAGELTADRVAALALGGADPITRVIFAAADRPCVHSGAFVDPATRVREIQAWTATTAFTRLVARHRQARTGDGSAAPVVTLAR